VIDVSDSFDWKVIQDHRSNARILKGIDLSIDE
jgi:hypothetical protein